MIVKVLTFNIHHGRGTDRQLNLDRIGAIIQTTGADIIGLNEVDRHFSERSQFKDQAKELAHYLNMQYAFGPAVTIETTGFTPKREFGNAILTKFPIQSMSNHSFDFLPKRTEKRALLEITNNIGNEMITTYVAHLSLNPFLHSKQIAFILEKIQLNKGSSIIVGDWNMTPSSPRWKHITHLLKDAWAEKGNRDQRGFTFPSRRPFRRLDYIFYSSELQLLNCEVVDIDRKASDHLPIIATFAIGSKAAAIPSTFSI
ncbi:endonuclease/exonuclease/phosphatase family protein [Peribacillus sp. SCS-155]|uniref:endonuclease/exonuclease/phosphatase family protein n=1 Tax=Peribacillus sedimenti TaxID=3115297 RepID=UPI0039063C56